MGSLKYTSNIASADARLNRILLLEHLTEYVVHGEAGQEAGAIVPLGNGTSRYERIREKKDLPWAVVACEIT